jgi:hypothetical protein
MIFNSVQGFDLGRERGCPFYMVFAYTPNGPVVYKIEATLLYRWRKLPRTYLNQLAEADRILDDA